MDKSGRKRGRPAKFKTDSDKNEAIGNTKKKYEENNKSNRNVSRRKVNLTQAQIIKKNNSAKAYYLQRRRSNSFSDFSIYVEDVVYSDIGDMDSPCLTCGGLTFKNEIGRSKHSCCHGGKVPFRQLAPYPEELKNFLFGDDDASRNFRNNIRVYNNSFAFASFNCVNADLQGHGPYSMRILGTANAKATTSLISENTPRYGQVYIFDDNETLLHRSNECSRVDVLTTINQTMKSNPYAIKYRQLYEVFQSSGETMLSLNFLSYNQDNERRYNRPHIKEIAAIIVSKDGVIPTSVDIKVFPKKEPSCDYISIASHHSDPMLFPLIFPSGEHGWDYRMKSDKGKNISPLQFYSSRLTERGTFNAVLYCGRLSQQYFINCYLTVESQRLKFHRFNQDKLRTECYQGLIDHVSGRESDSDARVGNRLVLPGSYQGSPRAMHMLYQDAMAICRKIGRPDLFITMTCNPHWPEIKRYLASFPTETSANDIPHFTSRLFYQKMTQLIYDLDDLFGEVLAYVYTVEFQKRGLPHVHILVTLKKKLYTSDDIDRFISAEIPNQTLNPNLWNHVTKHMLHGPHGKATPCYDMASDSCKKNFPKPFSNITDMSGNGFPRYRRRDNKHELHTYRGKLSSKFISVDNSMVVPYNPYLLMKYDCHINVEYCASVMSIKYIHKYIHKGHDRAKIQVNCDANHYNIDEIKEYLDSRYLSANESAWRIFELPLHGRSHSVERLPVHLEGKNQITFIEGKEEEAVEKNRHSKLTAYFELNKIDRNSRNIKYEDIPHNYRWNEAAKKWNPRINRCATVSRLVSVSPRATELFHLKLLLRKLTGACCFNDLKAVNNICYPTFQEAAVALGFVRNDSECEAIMKEAASTLLPWQLRRFFVYMLIGYADINAKKLWDIFKQEMSEDCNESKALNDINQLLLKENHCLESFHIQHETLCESTIESVNMESHVLQYNVMHKQLNNMQQAAFNAVIESLFDKEKNNCFFVDGPGGSGKTFLYKCIIHKAILENKKIISLAWTGIAAILLPFGRTAHKSFQLPLNLSDISTLYWDSKTKMMLKATDLFLWDEASMIPRSALESIDIALKDICNSTKPFGGKLFLLGGDFRQVLPVVRKAGRKQVVDATIKNSSLWGYFQIFTLTTNMRSSNEDHNFSSWLLSIGNGEVKDFVVPNELLSNDVVEDLYGGEVEYDKQINQAILSTRNDIVRQLNERIIELLPGSCTVCEGIDYATFKGSDGSDDSAEIMYPLEYINTLTPSGFPPQRLKLKRGAIVMLVRNLCVHDGLCNGTRLIILEIRKYTLKCRILTGDQANTIVTIPRIKLDSSSDTELPFILHRTQFPVRISFAMTINKSQGQTFQNVGIFLSKDHPIFTHGQLYVALSRCRSFNGIRIQLSGNGIDHVVKNIVYQEVL